MGNTGCLADVSKLNFFRTWVKARQENTELVCDVHQRLGIHVYKTGNAITGLQALSDVEANGRGAFAMTGEVILTNGDTIELYVSNEESTANVTVQGATIQLTAV